MPEFTLFPSDMSKLKQNKINVPDLPPVCIHQAPYLELTKSTEGQVGYFRVGERGQSNLSQMTSPQNMEKTPIRPIQLKGKMVKKYKEIGW